MSSRKIRSKEHVKKKRERQRRRWTMLVVLGLVLCAGLIGLTHWQAIQIDDFTVNTDSDLPKQQMREIVSSQFHERLWFVMDRQNILLLPRENITSRLTNLTHRIKSTEIDLTGLNSFAVSVNTRKPVAKVCSQSATTSSCRLVDEEGFVYANTADKQGTSTRLFVYNTSNLPSVGTHVKNEKTFRLLESFMAKLPDLSFVPISAKLKDHEDIYISTRNKSAGTTTASTSVQLRINLADDLNQKFTDLQTVVNKNSFVASTTGTTVNGTRPSISPFALEYIDLRFGNKVFYR